MAAFLGRAAPGPGRLCLEPGIASPGAAARRRAGARDRLVDQRGDPAAGDGARGGGARDRAGDRSGAAGAGALRRSGDLPVPRLVPAGGGLEPLRPGRAARGVASGPAALRPRTAAGRMAAFGTASAAISTVLSQVLGDGQLHDTDRGRRAVVSARSAPPWRNPSAADDRLRRLGRRHGDDHRHPAEPAGSRASSSGWRARAWASPTG